MQVSTANYTGKEPTFQAILSKVEGLYDKFAPEAVKKRKNIELAIQPDPVIISCAIWGIVQGHPSQLATYRAVVENLFPNDFPERSRYTRTCANLAFILKLIRHHLMKSLAAQPPLSAVDSMPLPLCKPVRNNRAKVLGDIASIGFNATKQAYFYGLKFHASASPHGHILAFVVTAANVHDSAALDEVAEQFPTEVMVGDKGYIGSTLKQRMLEGRKVRLVTPARRNMKTKPSPVEKALLKHRKTVETVFSSLTRLGLGSLQSRSKLGLESRIETILFAYSFLLERAQASHPNTLRYSLGY